MGSHDMKCLTDDFERDGYSLGSIERYVLSMHGRWPDRESARRIEYILLEPGEVDK